LSSFSHLYIERMLSLGQVGHVRRAARFMRYLDGAQHFFNKTKELEMQFSMTPSYELIHDMMDLMRTVRHTYIYTYIHTYIHTYRYSCIHMYIHTFIPTCFISTNYRTTYVFSMYIDYILYTHTYFHPLTHTYILGGGTIFRGQRQGLR
jgi:hypothetical protein